jgi:hypothetical protein
MAFSTRPVVTFSTGATSSVPSRRCCRTAWRTGALS